jgi:autotransporter-associated beta strand protein
MNSGSSTRLRIIIIALASVLSADAARGANFNWNNVTGNWDVGSNWQGGVAPSGTDATDVLTFGGDVASPYTSTNNLAVNPVLLNRLQLNATDTGATGLAHLISGTTGIALGGANPSIVQSGTGAVTINVPITLRAPLALTGDGGTVTLNNTITGAFDITKSGLSTFRFGTPFTAPVIGPSSNTWIGRLIIDGGTIRFNNNAEAGRTALRANPVFLNAASSMLTVSSELRTGALNGTTGLVESRVVGTNTDNESIVIHALTPGTYNGVIRLAAPTGTGSDTGTLVIRGVAEQTFAGDANSLQINKDVAVGFSASARLSGNASLASQTTSAAIVMNGGTFKLDNTTTNNANRLRDGTSASTGLESIGGGIFSLIGNALGTTELMARLQLGTATTQRSGALTINVTHNATGNIATRLTMQSLSRDGSVPTFATVDFTATDGTGAEIPLGASNSGPMITLNAPPPESNLLLRNTVLGANESTVGWATVNGNSFATYGSFGIAPVTLVALPLGTSPGNATANVEVTGDFTASSLSGYAVNSLRLAPSADNQSFSINTNGNLKTNAILLAGDRDYTIGGTGGIAGAAVGVSVGAARYVHVESATLTIAARIDSVSLPLVKAGAGTLVLTNGNNVNLTSPTVINSGVLRATPGLSLPAGELQLRGGVYEISGVTTFTRNVTRGLGAVNWSGVDNLNAKIGQDQGSGGFAAFGSDVVIDLNNAGPTTLAWEDAGFVNSGHALVFGSRTADRSITWSDNLSLSAIQQVVNYNARELRVNDNPNSNTDLARISGVISGSVQNDLLKTGSGRLELTGANTYTGSTIIHEGSLTVNNPGTIASSFLTDVRSGGTLGGTGTVGPVSVAPNGTLAPGSDLTNTGILSVLAPNANSAVTFTAPGARLSIQIGGTTAGTNYDQIAATGGVSLNGAALQGSLLNNFTPGPNDLFFIIINDGTDAVSGQFAEGNLVFLDFQAFNISYEGDSATNSISGGNDVVLQLVPEPATGALGALGVILLAARRRRTAHAA